MVSGKSYKLKAMDISQCMHFILWVSTAAHRLTAGWMLEATIKHCRFGKVWHIRFSGESGDSFQLLKIAYRLSHSIRMLRCGTDIVHCYKLRLLLLCSIEILDPLICFHYGINRYRIELMD